MLGVVSEHEVCILLQSGIVLIRVGLLSAGKVAGMTFILSLPERQRFGGRCRAVPSVVVVERLPESHCRKMGSGEIRCDFAVGMVCTSGVR